jgi:hypothetical protein
LLYGREAIERSFAQTFRGEGSVAPFTRDILKASMDLKAGI